MMTRMRIWLLFIIALVLLSSALVSSRTMWGIKKKQKEEELEDQMNDVLLKADKRKGKSSGSTSNEQPRKVERKPLSRSRASKSSPNDLFGSANPTEILAFYKLAIEKFKEIVNSDQFEQYFSKDTLQQVVKALTEQNLAPEVINSELKDKIENFNLDDIQLVKEGMLKGVEIAEGYLEQFGDVLSDPTKLTELLEQVPSEFRDVIQGLMSGDFSAIRKLIVSLPDVDPQQKQLILDALDGNFQNVLKASKDLGLGGGGGDSANDFIEAARQNLLSDPDTAVASGIPLESLQNPKLFAEFMQNSMKSLLNNDEALSQLNQLFGDEEEKEEEPIVKPSTKQGKSKQRVEL